jgi:hypothetical protein
LIPHGKFEKLPPAIEAFNRACLQAGLLGSMRVPFSVGKPGEAVLSLPPEDREALKDLTADMMNRYRFEAWQLKSVRA